MLLKSIRAELPTQIKGLDAMVSAWKVGQVLRATVQDKFPNSTLQLRIGKNILTARSTFPVEVGESLQLQVTGNDKDLVLRRLGGMDKPVNQPQLLNRSLRQNLPHHQDLQSVFKQISKIQQSSVNTRQGSPLPPALSKQLSELLSLIPDTRSITNPSSLKKFIHDSGTFLESKLSETVKAASSPDPDKPLLVIKQDLKATLLKTISMIDRADSSKAEGTKVSRETSSGDHAVHKESQHKHLDNSSNRHPPEITELRIALKAAVSRIQINQVHSFSGHENQTLPWLVELPVRDQNNQVISQLAVQYNRQDASIQDEVDKHSVKITLELNELGLIHIELNLSGKHIFSAIWADKKSTQTLIEKNIGSLEERFNVAGLNVDIVSRVPTRRMSEIMKFRQTPLLSEKI